jgi:hypothetical protein
LHFLSKHNVNVEKIVKIMFYLKELPVHQSEDWDKIKGER